MKVEISNKALRNLFMDFKKSDFDPKERASLLLQYRDKNGISQRKLAMDIGVPHSTIQDWELWNGISEDKIRCARRNGFTTTDIYRSLRNKNEEIIDYSRQGVYLMDNAIKGCLAELRPFVTKGLFGSNSEQFLLELRNVVNRILIRLERERKNRKL